MEDQKRTYWHDTFTLGQQTFPRFIGAPLDGYTDTPFRLVARTFSPDHLFYTTIRHTSCVAHHRSGALKLDPRDTPIIFQITANSTNSVQKAVENILALQAPKPCAIDLNIGCPAKNVVKSRSGSALMADVPLLTEIVKILRAASTIPITIKMRAGFKEPNAFTVAQLMCDLGVDALAIHPRLQPQKFSGNLDYEVVNKIKNTVKVPVLYSGGIKTFSDAVHVYEATGVDGFLVGQAFLGHPWKLAELTAHAHGLPYDVSFAQSIKVALDHFNAMCDFYGAGAVNAFKKHATHYIRNIEHAPDIRMSLYLAKKPEQVREILAGLVSDGQKV